MKNPCTHLLFVFGFALSAQAAELTLEEAKKEIELTKAKLAVAEAKLDLAAKQTALDKLQGKSPGRAAEPAQDETTASAPPKPDPKPITAEQAKINKLPAFSWAEVNKEGSDLFFHAGTRVVAPYTIDQTTKKLSTEGGDLGGFLELVYTNTWAWKPANIQSSLAGDQWAKRWQGDLLKSKGASIFLNPFKADWDQSSDFSARLSFEYGNEETASVGTVTGSGDFGAEVAGNKHFFQGYTHDSAWSVGLGGAIGAVTDRKTRSIHPRFFGGLVANISRVIESDEGKTKRLALLRLGFGYARIDNLKLDPTDPTGETVLFKGSLPVYERKTGPAAEAELFYPVGKAAYVTVGARLYGEMDPSPWSLSLGYTIDPIEALKGFIPEKNTSEPAAEKKK